MRLNVKGWAGDFARGHAALAQRRADWAALEAMAEPRFKSIARRAQLYDFPDALYVSSHKEQPQTTSMKWMSLHSGTRAIGAGLDGGALTEGGCALHLTQDVTGNVWTVLYPFRNEMREQAEEYLVVDRVAHPGKVSARRLERRVGQFMSYSRLTTVGECASRWDKITVRWARARHRYPGLSAPATTVGVILDFFRRVPFLGRFVPRVVGRMPVFHDDEEN